MADPAKRAERAQDRAAIAAVRAGDDDTAQEILDAGSAQELAAPSPVDVINQRIQSQRAGVPDIATAQTVEELTGKLKELQKYVDEFRRRQNEVNAKNAKAFKALRRWTNQYSAAFSEFHGEAKNTRDEVAGGLDTAARVLSGYMDGINFGEQAANPSLLGIAKALEATEAAGGSILGGMSAVAGAVLRYMAYNGPLASGGTTTTQAALLQ